jgi:hypothetical protein
MSNSLFKQSVGGKGSKYQHEQTTINVISQKDDLENTTDYWLDFRRIFRLDRKIE